MRRGSESVSRHHCVLLVDGDTVFVRDLGSRNGTFVNGDRIMCEKELADGDQLVIGPLRFTLFVSAESTARAGRRRSCKSRDWPDEFDVSERLE